MSFGPSDSYGSLPAGWRMERLKFSAEVRNSNVDKVISEDETPVWLCNYTDVYYNDRITSDMDFMEGSATDVELARFRLRSGQVLLTKDSESWQDIGVPALVVENMPDVVCGYHLSVLDPCPELDGGYLAWLCRSAPLNDQFKLGANGVTRFGLGQYPLKNAWVAIPPIDVQQRIARFLDEKTARIDALIEKKQTLLERLAEKRQALITSAVTEGLNPDAPMKHSGVDWLGNIPSHWDCKRLRFVAREPLKYGLNAPADVDNPDWPRFVRITDVDEDGALKSETFKSQPPEVANEHLLEEQDILLARSGATVGKSFIYRRSWGIACFAGYLIRIRVKRELSAEFIYQALNSAAYWEWVSAHFIQSTIQNINAERYANFWVALPPTRDEQDRIANHVESACSLIESEVQKINKSITHLSEYRSAIITAAVTGQLSELNR